MRINVKLENTEGFRKKILNGLQIELNSRLIKNRDKIEQRIRKILYRSIKSQPEYKSLLGGQLQSELGVVNTSSKLEELITEWLSGIKLTIHKIKIEAKQLVGGVSLIISRDNYNNLLSHSAATYYTEKGEEIEWLRWLLLEGDKTIIRQYQIGIDLGNYARTGLGNIMIRGGRWSVPSEFSGTARNNFLTRALDSVDSQIGQAIQDILR